jgi:hypothetical protein
MEDTFREPTPAEIQRAVLQFMGENIGELKTLDSHIINRTNTLNGITLRPEDVLKSIPPPQNIPQQQQNTPQQPQQQQNTPQIQQPIDVPPAPLQQQDSGQLEFDFNPSHYEEIMKILNTHTRELKEINTSLRELSDIITSRNKKKD